MTFMELILGVLSALGITATTIAVLWKILFKHILARDLENFKISRQAELEQDKAKLLETLEGLKAGWLQDLERKKAEWQGDVRQEVELFLGDKSAEREYTSEAKKRLYTAIGPLKFQLLLACRDVYSRIKNYGFGKCYSMNMDNDYYYGKNTLYRLLRPIAIAEIIERQITYADFSVEPSSIVLLRFKKAAFAAFSDGEAFEGHPNAEWKVQKEHLFSGTLNKLANAMITKDEYLTIKERPLYLHEFENLLGDSQKLEPFLPLYKILHEFTIEAKPLFWIRLVCFGFICHKYVDTAGLEIGFIPEDYDVKSLLGLSKEEYNSANINRYINYFNSINNMGL